MQRVGVLMEWTTPLRRYQLRLLQVLTIDKRCTLAIKQLKLVFRNFLVLVAIFVSVACSSVVKQS